MASGGMLVNGLQTGYILGNHGGFGMGGGYNDNPSGNVMRR